MANEPNNAQRSTGTRRGMKVPGAPAPHVGGPAAASNAAAAQAAPAGGEASGSKKRTVIVVIACVLLAILVWLLIWLFACGGSMMDPNARSGQAPYKTEDEMQAELDRVVEEGMFNISIASVINFADGAAAGTAYIENVPGNQYNMQVSIVDDDSGDLLYESGVLQPNQYIEDITLTKKLPAGSYNATATFTALDPTTYEEVGQAAAKITLNVEA